jgi:hypothetical protein
VNGDLPQNCVQQHTSTVATLNLSVSSEQCTLMNVNIISTLFFRASNPTKAEDFSSSLCVKPGSGAHPAFCTLGTGVPFPGVKRGRSVMLTTHRG